ncbi:hypothetical protein OIU79_002678 [Salix purpurea]|uniref:Uncharacterized protein n=1 Tax=Salix purpurea TaxID=77065 RepID=A0A9Q0UJR5_SALPP|nr:hypothetical protein OIU79_002678 [Salix purpurea]
MNGSMSVRQGNPLQYTRGYLMEHALLIDATHSFCDFLAVMLPSSRPNLRHHQIVAHKVTEISDAGLQKLKIFDFINSWRKEDINPLQRAFKQATDRGEETAIN